ncbi:hypothetical protein [Thiosulfatihalobacter marinus]|uniref:hypothetical protein n=1 Tax=Thiosulfatihalobacter marinus TaxID=2792481 RepID=UPI0018D94F29|nr:hypothetical protein [Thiosulfatihalobacter marinus]
MKHVPPPAQAAPRHARLFELIRQENLAQERTSHAKPRAPVGSVSEFLKQSAAASLRKKH